MKDSLLNWILFQNIKSNSILSFPEYAIVVIKEKIKAVIIMFKYCIIEEKIEKIITNIASIFFLLLEIFQRIFINKLIELIVVFI